MEKTTNSPQKELKNTTIVIEEIRNKFQFAKFCIFSTAAVLVCLIFLVCNVFLFVQDSNLSEKIRILQQNLKAEQNTKNEIIANNKGLLIINSCQSADNSGVFLMELYGDLFGVYCEVEPEQGNKWLVFQRRIDGSENFYRNWSDYENGFGNKNGEFWLGLNLLHAITKSQSYQLRVDLENWENNTAYAVYKIFEIGDSESNYKLTVGNYSGNASDSLSYHNNKKFTTKDRKNDSQPNFNCAVRYTGAWWYYSCYRSNLNGKYFKGGQINDTGVIWYNWKDEFYSLKAVQMKIRPNVIN